MRKPNRVLLAVLTTLSVGLFALTTMPEPVDALASEDIYDAHCDLGPGASAVLGNKKYAESFTAGHTGGSREDL
jgi:hypothetical protein